MYVSSDFGTATSIVLMVAGGLLLLLVRGFNTKHMRRAEVLTVVAALSGQVIGMVGGTMVREAMLRRDCANTGDRLSCLGVVHKQSKVQQAVPKKPR